MMFSWWWVRGLRKKAKGEELLAIVKRCGSVRQQGLIRH
jgi:hypothetical protein